MGLWSFTFEYYANVLKAIAGDWNVDLPLPFVGDLWWLGVFSNEESGREFVFCSGAWPRAGSLAGTCVGSVRPARTLPLAQGSVVVLYWELQN